MGIRQVGKKGKEWIRDRAKLIKKGILLGRIQLNNGAIVGRCEDCGKWKQLDPDHRKKRSQGGSNEYENIDWVCRECHNKRDNMGDPKNKKTKNKKAEWQLPHKCISCKNLTSQLICENCGRLSIK